MPEEPDDDEEEDVAVAGAADEVLGADVLGDDVLELEVDPQPARTKAIKTAAPTASRLTVLVLSAMFIFDPLLGLTTN